MESQSEGGSIGQSELAKGKRAKYLNERINQYNGMARTKNSIRKWLMRSIMTLWKMSDEGMEERHEEISDKLFDYFDFYKGKPLKLQWSCIRSLLPQTFNVLLVGIKRGRVCGL